MAQRIHKGFWLLRVILLSASLVGVLLMIEQFQGSKVSFEPFVPADASNNSNLENAPEREIKARVIRN